jgi:hypothetical protein
LAGVITSQLEKVNILEGGKSKRKKIINDRAQVSNFLTVKNLRGLLPIYNYFSFK